MKTIATFFCLILTALTIAAQKPGAVLATANGRTYAAQNLAPEAQKLVENAPAIIAETRSSLLSQMIADRLLDAEAAARGVKREQLVTEAYAKVPAPADAQIKAVYDENQAAFEGKTVAQAKPQIVAFLRREPEQKALQTLIESLKTKHKVTVGKNIGAPDLKPLETVASVDGKTISAQDFEESNKNELYEVRAQIYDQLRMNLEETVFNDLLAAEAKSQNIETGDLIAREISDKIRDYTDIERYTLTNNLKNRLFAKYKAEFTLDEPAPPVQNIETAGNPSKGSPTAPVTIVMFTDFQCPACSAAHPILQQVMAEYKGKIRFVVRDFPLVNIHENAFAAALAANAAFRQGKFFEYTEKLYANQTALDAASLKKYAAETGLNAKQFELDLNDEKIAADVRRDLADGAKYGITGTPSIFVNGIKVRQNSAENFRAAIEKALRGSR